MLTKPAFFFWAEGIAGITCEPSLVRSALTAANPDLHLYLALQQVCFQC